MAVTKQEYTVTLDEMTLGDIAKLESGKFSLILEVFQKVLVIKGVKPEGQADAIANLHWTEVSAIVKAIQSAVVEATDGEQDPN